MGQDKSVRKEGLRNSPNEKKASWVSPPNVAYYGAKNGGQEGGQRELGFLSEEEKKREGREEEEEIKEFPSKIVVEIVGGDP
uniref:Uncharacterized protein n=1 Tax=Solanum tuberosum TaxID=4113 RepID=M1DG21_SOLTU